MASGQPALMEGLLCFGYWLFMRWVESPIRGIGIITTAVTTNTLAFRFSDS